MLIVCHCISLRTTQDMAHALEQERAQYEQHVAQLEAHHASLQTSHQKQTALLTARMERSAQEVADSAARLREAHSAALDREETLRAAREEAEGLRRSLQAARDECDALRLTAHAPQQGYASPMQTHVPAMPARTPLRTPIRTPLAPRMAPQSLVDQPCPTPKATAATTPLLRAASHAEESDTPLMQSAGLSPLSPALFALLEGGESPQGDLLTPRVLPQEDYLRLSSVPDTATRSGRVEGSPGGASTTQAFLPREGHQFGNGGEARGGGAVGRSPLRASVHGYPTVPAPHVDERVRHWVAADDPSERTTVADPLVWDVWWARVQRGIVLG